MNSLAWIGMQVESNSLISRGLLRMIPIKRYAFVIFSSRVQSHQYVLQNATGEVVIDLVERIDTAQQRHGLR